MVASRGVGRRRLDVGARSHPVGTALALVSGAGRAQYEPGLRSRVKNAEKTSVCELAVPNSVVGILLTNHVRDIS